MENFYNTLGVDENANPDQIKQAYRKLAAQHHPDRGGDTAKFQQIEEAYRVLSDPNQKAQYDNPQPQGFGHNPFNNGLSFNMGHGDFQDIFAQMFANQRPPAPAAPATGEEKCYREDIRRRSSGKIRRGWRGDRWPR